MSLRSIVRIALLVLTTAHSVAADEAVSFYREIRPILQQNCNGCHRPGKTKGGLDLTTHAAMLKGGKHGAALKVGEPKDSRLIEEISGDEPEMPDEGEPLSAAEIALIEHWIAQGAKDDTPADAGTHRLAAPPVYRSLPAVSALAWSQDGQTLAVSGYHEVLLYSSDGAQLLGRLVGESPTITSLAFSPDSKLLVVGGGASSEYGEIQIWDVAAQKQVRSVKVTNDAVYGVAFSPDGIRVSAGCSDKTVRVFAVEDGRELMKCDNHIDWVFGTAFSQDGTKIVSASRDRALKLIDVSTGHLIDDVSKPYEPLISLTRSPREDLVICGSDNGMLRLYRMEPRGGRLAEGDDKENSFVREFGRISGPVNALAFSADGTLFAAAGKGEVRVYNVADGKRLGTIKTEGGAFAVAFHPEGKIAATAGYDGKVHLFDPKSGQEIRTFDSVPLAPQTVAR